jgi:hypothetical protein
VQQELALLVDDPDPVADAVHDGRQQVGVLPRLGLRTPQPGGRGGDADIGPGPSAPEHERRRGQQPAEAEPRGGQRRGERPRAGQVGGDDADPQPPLGLRHRDVDGAVVGAVPVGVGADLRHDAGGAVGFAGRQRPVGGVLGAAPHGGGHEILSPQPHQHPAEEGPRPRRSDARGDWGAPNTATSAARTPGARHGAPDPPHDGPHTRLSDSGAPSFGFPAISVTPR